MLERLDEIEWGELSHAYGVATDVPLILRALAEGDGFGDSKEFDDDDLVLALGNRIAHQGSLYPATLPAVPFLMEIVEKGRLSNRNEIVDLLVIIANGWNGIIEEEAESETYVVKIRERFEHREELYRACHQAVEDGFDLYCRLLMDEEIVVSRNAAFLLASLINRREECAAALLESIDESEEDQFLGAALLALMVLAKRSSGHAVQEVILHRFRQVVSNEEEGIVARLGAGIGELWLGDYEQVDEILELVRPHLVSMDSVFVDLPWREGDYLFGLIDRGLRGNRERRLQWIVEGLQHFETEVCRVALRCGEDLCREWRGGPGILSEHFEKLVDHSDSELRSSAVYGLSSLGREGLERLKAFPRGKRSDVRRIVSQVLERAARDAKVRAQWLKETRPWILRPVQVLLTSLSEERSNEKGENVFELSKLITELGFHGSGGKASVELLTELMDHSSPWVHVAAIRALVKIEPDHKQIVPKLLEKLASSSGQHAFRLIDAFKQLGRNASGALPMLRKMIDTEDRVVGSGSMHEACVFDEEFCDLCREAIRVIEGAKG